MQDSQQPQPVHTETADASNAPSKATASVVMESKSSSSQMPKKKLLPLTAQQVSSQMPNSKPSTLTGRQVSMITTNTNIVKDIHRVPGLTLDQTLNRLLIRRKLWQDSQQPQPVHTETTGASNALSKESASLVMESKSSNSAESRKNRRKGTPKHKGLLSASSATGE